MPEALYADIRPKADYRRSLGVLNILNTLKREGAGILVKSSIIVGLGETGEDVSRTLRDLKAAGVDIVYIGQYLILRGVTGRLRSITLPKNLIYWEKRPLKWALKQSNPHLWSEVLTRHTRPI